MPYPTSASYRSGWRTCTRNCRTGCTAPARSTPRPPVGEELRSKAWLVWTALRTEQRAMRGSPLVVIGAAVQPVVLLLITDRRAPHSPDRTADILFAIILTSVWSTTVWMAGGVLRRER